MGGYYILMGVGVLFGIIGMVVSGRLKSRFKEYSKIPTSGGLTGKEVAEKMLRDNGITDVEVISTRGELTDHYNPAKKTVNLSEPVFNSNSVAAAAVAAHECGHAVQHAQAYAWLQLRSKLVPVVQVTSSLVQWVILGGILLISIFPQLLLFGIFLFATTTLFSIITLPVEIDASNRALAWLNHNSTGVVNPMQHEKAKNALKWAAYTYVVAALGSIASLLTLVLIYMGRRS